MHCCRLLFFLKSYFRKILSGIPSECQIVWIQILFQTVCKGYQQMTLVDMALKINNMNNSNALAFVTQHLIG